MKTYLSLIIGVLFSVSIMSCGSDDDGNAPQVDPIIGTWDMIQVNQNVQEDGVVVIDENFSLNVCGAPILFTFSEDGMLTITEFELDFDFDINGNVSIDCDVYSNNLTGTWQFLNNDVYIITNEGETNQIIVSFPNNNVINFTFSDTFVEDGVSYIESFTFTGNRQ